MSVKRKKQNNTDLIITANRLTDGAVVFFTGKVWSTDIAFALISWDSDYLTKLAEDTIEFENMISVELVNIKQERMQITPVSMREKIRALGPTINYSEINKLTRRDDNVSI